MQKNKSGFTLIEIIVSTMILTTGVFAIYKMLSINTNNLNNYDNLAQSKNLIENTKECIKSIGFDNFSLSSQTGYYFNFGNDNKGCQISSSGILVDNKTYFVSGEITSKNASKISFVLSSKAEGLNTQTGAFNLYK